MKRDRGVGARFKSCKLFPFIKRKETAHVWSDSGRVGLCRSAAACCRYSVFVLKPSIRFISIQIREL